MNLIIGIDPDVEASGIAFIKQTPMPDGRRQTNVGVDTLPLPKLLQYVATVCVGNPGARIFVEAGWLNQSNWHLARGDSRAVAAAKGMSAGRNHQIGRDIADLLSAAGRDVVLVRPLQKCWAGPNRKITHQELAAICAYAGAIGFPRRSNQEERDALLLAWTRTSLPINPNAQPLTN